MSHRGFALLSVSHGKSRVTRQPVRKDKLFDRSPKDRDVLQEGVKRTAKSTYQA